MNNHLEDKVRPCSVARNTDSNLEPGAYSLSAPAVRIIVEREGQEPVVLDARKRCFIVCCRSGKWGRSVVSVTEAAKKAILAGAAMNEPAVALTVIGDDEAFVMEGGYLSISPSALNCGTVPVAAVAALLVKRADP